MKCRIQTRGLFVFRTGFVCIKNATKLAKLVAAVHSGNFCSGKYHHPSTARVCSVVRQPYGALEPVQGSSHTKQQRRARIDGWGASVDG